jgi:outer membrane immunogenic protein
VLLKSAIRIVAIVALFGTSVRASDLPEAPSSAPIPNVAEAPPAVSIPSWTGPYIGLGVGLRYDAVDANVTSAAVGTPPASIALPPAKAGSGNFLETAAPATMAFVDNIALRGGIYGGWNYQITPNYVIGAEADFGWAHETAVLHGSPYPTNLLFGSPSLPFGATPQDRFRVTTDWDGSIALRVGRLLTPSTLLYLSGGLAWAHIQATSTCSTTPTANVLNCAPGNYLSGTLGPASIQQSATALGWTGAIGLEVRLWSNWIARGQYRFSGFDYPSGSNAFTFATTRTCTGCPSAASSPLNVSFQLPVMLHSFEFGIAYKFGLFGTPVQAADLPEAPAVAPTPNLAEMPPVPTPNWTGPYIGPDFGFRYDAVSANVTSATVGIPPTAIAVPPATTGSSGNYNIALRGGAYGGWNYQITPDYVIGVEGNFGWAHETAVLHGSAYPGNLLFGSPSLPFGATNQDIFRVTTNWDGSIALRVGRLLTPWTLLYVSGGLAWANIQVSSNCSHVPTANVSNCAPGNYFSGTLGPEVVEQSATALGWTGGIGLETRLWSNWIARGQYRLSGFNSNAFTFATTRTCTGCPSAASSPLNVSFQVPVLQHSFEFGIAYKFGS